MDVVLQESTGLFSVLDIENTMNAIKIGIVTFVITGILIGGLYFVFENLIDGYQFCEMTLFNNFYNYANHMV